MAREKFLTHVAKAIQECLALLYFFSFTTIILSSSIFINLFPDQILSHLVRGCSQLVTV